MDLLGRQLKREETGMEKVFFYNSLGQRIVGWLHADSSGSRLGPTIILCHGMMSSKEGTKQKAFALAFEESGFSVLRFDFSFCGESGGRFEEITFAQEVDDLRSAVRWVRERGGEPIGLVGSSMGGAVAILYTSQDPSVAALVTLAAVGFPARLAARIGDLESKAQAWKEAGYTLGAEGEVGERFLEDAARQDVLAAARCLSIPLLVLHGGADEEVPVEDAHAIHANAGGLKQLRVLPGVDHRFTQPGALQEALELAKDWFQKHLTH